MASLEEEARMPLRPPLNYIQKLAKKPAPEIFGCRAERGVPQVVRQVARRGREVGAILATRPLGMIERPMPEPCDDRA